MRENRNTVIQRVLVMIVILLSFCMNVYSQSIEIIESANTDKTQDKQTTIVFTSRDNSPVNIYRLNWGQQTVGNIGNSDAVFNELGLNFFIAAPAKFIIKDEIDNLIPGDKTGTNRSFNKIFDIQPTGGTQYWEISRYSSGKYWGGCILASVGISAAVFGILGFIPDNPLMSSSAAVGLSLAGAAAATSGFVVMFDGMGHAKLKQTVLE
jgi:hypothetical protein